MKNPPDAYCTDKPILRIHLYAYPLSLYHFLRFVTYTVSVPQNVNATIFLERIELKNATDAVIHARKAVFLDKDGLP